MSHPRISIYGRHGAPGTFCMVCGARLVEHEVPDGVDARTGKPRVVRRRDCPVALAEPEGGTSP